MWDEVIREIWEEPLTRVTFVTKVEYFTTPSNIPEVPKCSTHISDVDSVHLQICCPQQLYK